MPCFCKKEKSIMTPTFRSNARNLALIVMIGIQPLPLFAASTDLTDTPLPVASSVEPNIMFMIDTSGSMYSIVPDTPYDASVTYLTCPNGHQLSGNFATVTAASSVSTVYSLTVDNSTGATYIDVGSSTNNPPTYYTFGSTGGNNCFIPDQYYNAALNAYNTGINENGSGGRGSSMNKAQAWPPAIYTGNYLNWYFGSSATPATADNFGAGAQMKSNVNTRINIAKSAASTVVTGLDKVRIGLFTYDNPNGDYSNSGGKLLLGMLDLSTNRSTVTTAISNVAIVGYGPGTPLAETHAGIGRYFAKTGSSSYTPNLILHPGKANQSRVATTTVFPVEATGSGSSAAPIQAYCQRSFAVLVTDGLATVDRDVNTNLQDYAGYCANNAWNCPASLGYGMRTYQEAANCAQGNTSQCVAELYESSSSKPSDYLDDVAGALYDIDLRPDLVPPSGSKTGKNNIATYVIGFADPTLDYSTLIPRTAAQGGGLSFTVKSAADLATAFSRITDDILAKDGSAAAVAVANAHVTNTDNAAYATSYNSGVWTGDLLAYPINTSTGVPNIQTPIWDTGCSNPTAYVDPTDTTKGILGCSAQVLLDLKTSTTRKIFTSNDTSSCFYSCGIPFQPTTAIGVSGTDKLSSAQQTLLNTPALTDGTAVVSYLRGDKSGEATGTYRSRAHLLGDTVNAEPLVIREPDRNYLDAGYSTFKASNDNRTRVILQAANDGLLHAFNSLSGVEEWAYVPNLLISNAKDPNSSTTSLLNTRSRKASFSHYFLLDGTPTAGDVDFNNSGTTGNTTTNWGTIAVSGLGKGGRGYFALNLTSTTATDEAGAAAKALWEFPRSITNATQRASALLNMGYSYGKPIIVKTTAAGWVVLVTSGYNNGTNSGDSGGDGLGHLFVLNASTGDLIADLATTGCNATPTTNPCGLADINAYVENRDIDNTVDIAYGGDLYGNLYRFDLRGTTVAGWSVSKLAKLRSGVLSSDPVQPITTVPELSKITISGTNQYFVYVGTGMYLGRTDLPCPPSPATCSWTPDSQSTQTQTMYGLIDPRDGTTLPDPLLGSLVAQTYTTAGTTRTFTTNTVDYSTKKGWYTNFTAGERLTTDPALASGALVFTSNIPGTTSCVPGGSSWLYALDYQTGGQITGASFGGTFLASALASRPVLIQLPNGSVKAIVRLSDTTTVTTAVPTAGSSTTGRRVSWRELIDK